MGTPDHLRRVRELGGTIKATEESASQARLARMWAVDAQRREELARARAERARRDRRAVALALGLGTIVVVIAIVVAIVAAGSAPVPLS